MGAWASVQAMLDEIQRTVALAARRRSGLSLEEESRRLALRHPTALFPLHEVRAHLLRMAAERQVLCPERLETAFAKLPAKVRDLLLAALQALVEASRDPAAQNRPPPRRKS